MLMKPFKVFREQKLWTIAGVLVVGFGAVACSESIDTAETQQRIESEPVSDEGVTPFILSPAGPGGNVTCEMLGYEYSTERLDFPEDYPFDFDGIDVTVTDGTYVEWESEFRIGAVIVKGSNEANIYEYDPQSFGDSGLAPPLTSSGRPAGLSNLTFCWDAMPLVGELTVEKTARTAFTRTHDWSIKKDVDPDTLYLYIDGSGDKSVKWTVKVKYEDYVDSGFIVFGAVSIANTGDLDARVDSITDILPGDLEEEIEECLRIEENGNGETFVLGEDILAPGEEIECVYSFGLEAKEDGKNKVLVEGYFIDGELELDPFDYGAKDYYAFDEPTTELHASVTITDTNPGFAEKYGPDPVVLHAPSSESDPVKWTFTYKEDFAYEDYEECGKDKIRNIARVIGDKSEVLDKARAKLRIYIQCLIFDGETAWAANANVPGELRYTTRGNWATYVEYDGEKTTTLFAGQHINVGTVHFSAPLNGTILITVELSGNWEFEDTSGNMKVQDYADAPSGNPAPGQFDYHVNCPNLAGERCEVEVPLNNFYGVHVNVGQWVPDPDFGP